MILAIGSYLSQTLGDDVYFREGFGTKVYFNETTLHPAGLILLVILGLGMLIARRSRVVVPLLLMTLFVAPSQRVVIAELDFTLLRVMTVLGLARVLMRGEYRRVRWHGLDAVVAVWVLVNAIAYIALRGAVVNRMGMALDVLGGYALLRCCLRSWEDLDVIVKTVAWASLPIACVFIYEQMTGLNFFSYLGGVNMITKIRDGRLRCMGPFPHPIVAGAFWATMVPLLLAGRARGLKPGWLIHAGVLSSVAIVMMTASSTPVLALLVAAAGILAFPYRRYTAGVRWGTVLVLIGLHFIMKAPVWHLIARIDVIGGSTGWHRYHLIDEAVNHFREWAVMGTVSTAHWGWGLFDVTNQYVLEAVEGGLGGLFMFMLTLWITFSRLGRIIRAERPSLAQEQAAWLVGVTLFVQCVYFIAVSISYCRQNLLLFVLVLALVGSLGERRRPRLSGARGRQAARALPDPLRGGVEGPGLAGG